MAGKFDDSQLRLQALKLSDPYDQSNLVFEVREGVSLVDILNIYTFEKYPREKAYCVACGCHRHKRGFTALLSDGTRAMYGSACGEEAFGESWKEAEERIQERADRQFELKKLDRLSRCTQSLESLAGWEKAAERLDFRRQAFDRLGELASRAREAARNKQGMLTYFHTFESAALKALGKKSAVSEEVEAGRLKGYQFLCSGELLPVVSSVRSALSVMALGLQNTDKISTKTLEKRRRKLEQALTALEEVADCFDAAADFWTVENFESLIRWAVAHGITKEKYFIEEGVIRRPGRQDGLVIEFAVPEVDFTLLDAVKDYRRAD